MLTAFYRFLGPLCMIRFPRITNAHVPSTPFQGVPPESVAHAAPRLQTSNGRDRLDGAPAPPRSLEGRGRKDYRASSQARR